jgi:hypothetical protein
MIREAMIGASPSDGSSSSSIRGRPISARPIDSIWRSPPDSELACRRRCSSSRGKRSKTSRSTLGRSRRSRRNRQPSRRFSSTLSSAITPPPSGTCASPRRTMSSAFAAVMSSSQKRTRPERGRTIPDTARSSELLPAPFAPSTAVMLPAGTLSDTPSTAHTGP